MMSKRMLRDISNLQAPSSRFKRLKVSSSVSVKEETNLDIEFERANKRLSLLLRKVCHNIDREKRYRKFNITEDIKIFVVYIEKGILNLGLSISTYFIAVRVYLRGLSTTPIKQSSKVDCSIFHFKQIIAAISIASKFNEIYIPSIRRIRNSVSKSLKKRLKRVDLISAEMDLMVMSKFRIPSQTIYSIALSLIDVLKGLSVVKKHTLTKHIIGSLLKVLTTKYPNLLTEYNSLELSLAIVFIGIDQLKRTEITCKVEECFVSLERYARQSILSVLSKKLLNMVEECNQKYCF